MVLRTSILAFLLCIPLAACAPTNLSDAIERHDMNATRTFIQQSKGPDPADYSDPLHVAATAGNAEAIELLLQRGDDINAPDSSGDTPLILAVTNDKVDAVRVLLAHHADGSILSPAGFSPLQIAACGGRPDIATLLLDAGLQPSALANDPHTTARVYQTTALYLLAHHQEAQALSCLQLAAPLFIASADQAQKDLQTYADETLGDDVAHLPDLMFGSLIFPDLAKVREQNARNKQLLQEQVKTDRAANADCLARIDRLQKAGIAPSPYPPPGTPIVTAKTIQPKKVAPAQPQQAAAFQATSSAGFLLFKLQSRNPDDFYAGINLTAEATPAPDEPLRAQIAAALAAHLPPANNPEENTTVYVALAKWATPDQTAVLTERLRDAPVSDISHTPKIDFILPALATAGGPDAVPAIVPHLRDFFTRSTAEHALTSIGPKAEFALLPFLLDPDADIAHSVGTVLQANGTPAILPALQKAAAEHPDRAADIQPVLDSISHRYPSPK